MNSDFQAPASPVKSLSTALNEMEGEQLVRRLDESDPAYLFKHALVQDSVYGAMMRHDRKRLHLLVGEALEKAYPDRTGEFASRLGEHFEEAGDRARAMRYFTQAAEDAAAQYANREALAFYTRALDAANELTSDTRDSLHRARGQVYERIGEFDKARADLEDALAIAQATHDEIAEWQSLMDLGFAWLARDYANAGEYFEKALELARASHDDLRVAHTLNRVGNWYLNNEDPQRALAYHQEALSMFQALNNRRGLAETEDLLGMTNLLGSDMFAAREHFSKSLALSRELDDPRGYVTSLVSNYLYGASMQGDTVVLPPSPGDNEEGVAEILRLTRQVGWRAGEAYGLWVMGEGFAAVGKYDRGFELLERALSIAREIDHRQWLAAATMVYGAIHADILDFETSYTLLDTALTLSHEIGSTHWIRTASGLLASVCIERNEIERAEKILDEALPPDTPARTLGQRQSWMARVELALAKGDPALALERIAFMLQGAFNMTPTTVIPHLWILRGQALMQQGKLREAEVVLRATDEEMHHNAKLPLYWRELSVLAALYRRQGRTEEATRTEEHALTIINTLANTISNPAQREKFIERATALVRGA